MKLYKLLKHYNKHLFAFYSILIFRSLGIYCKYVRLASSSFLLGNKKV